MMPVYVGQTDVGITIKKSGIMKTAAPQIVLSLLISLGLSTQSAWAQSTLTQSELAQSTSAQSELTQDSAAADRESFASFRIAPKSVLSEAAAPLISIARNREARDFQGALVDDALNFNLGVRITPIEGLNLSADAWQQEVKTMPSVDSAAGQQGGQSRLYIEESAINEFNLDNPLLGPRVESNGFDLGASYVWDTDRFGQFTLSTKTTYVQEFENSGGLLELANGEIAAINDRVISPELQSSLMLTWEFGNHTATAITNYFNSFKDISELDMDEINAIFDDITTFDLQYGYSVKTGENDRAIISFGIRNIFDEKTSQILNSTTRILDQNGRVAYGSIKYQF
jgi:hypothetical protein